MPARPTILGARDQVFSTVLCSFAFVAALVGSCTDSWTVASVSDPTTGERVTMNAGLRKIHACLDGECQSVSSIASLDKTDESGKQPSTLYRVRVYVGLGLWVWGGVIAGLMLLVGLSIWVPSLQNDLRPRGAVAVAGMYLLLIVAFHLLVPSEVSNAPYVRLGFSTYFAFSAGLLALGAIWMSWHRLADSL